MNQPHTPPSSSSKSKLILVSFLTLVALLSPGCAKKLVFVTHTSVGLDVSGTANLPNKVSFSYNRFEGALVPRNPADPTHGHSIYGGMDTDVKFDLPPRYSIQQTFATGKAAEYAVDASEEAKNWQGPDGGSGSRKTNNATTTIESHTDKSGAVATTTTTTSTTTTEATGTQTTTGSTCTNNAAPGGKARPRDKPMAPSESIAPLVFITGTTFGLHLSVGEQGTPANALLGYRRSEATTIPIPVPTEQVRSVYADISISAHIPDSTKSTNTAPRSELGGVRIKQAFATGRAAESLARRPGDVRTKLDKMAGGSHTEYAASRLEKENAALRTIDEFRRQTDKTKQQKIAAKAGELGLFDAPVGADQFPDELKRLFPKMDIAQLRKLHKFAKNPE